MKCKKAFLISLVIVIAVVAFLFVHPVFSQVKKEGIRSYSGVIDALSRDYKFIFVNERRFTLSPATRIVDANGNPLSLFDLKPGSSVTIEMLRNPDGSSGKKIIVTKRKGANR